MLKEKLLKSKKETEGLHAWADLQWNSRMKDKETLKMANAVLRTDIAKLTTKANVESLKLQLELQMEKENTALQTKAAARP